MFHNDYLNPITIPQEKPKLIHKGKLFYSLKRIYLITKDDILSEKNNKVCKFYFLTKFPEFQKTSYCPEAKPTDILIDSIQALLPNIINSCAFRCDFEYKINLFTFRMNIIDSTPALLKYEGDMIYAKIIEYQQKPSEEQEKELMLKLDPNPFRRLYPIIERPNNEEAVNVGDNSSNASARQLSYKNHCINNNSYKKKGGNLVLSQSITNTNTNTNMKLRGRISQKFYPLRDYENNKSNSNCNSNSNNNTNSNGNNDRQVLRSSSEVMFPRHNIRDYSNSNFNGTAYNNSTAIRKDYRNLVLPSMTKVNKLPSKYYSFKKKNYDTSSYSHKNRHHLHLHKSASSSLLSSTSSISASALLNKTKYTFKANLYPIDPEITEAISTYQKQKEQMKSSESQKTIKLNNHVKTIREFLQSKHSRMLNITKASPDKPLPICLYDKLKSEYAAFISETRDYITTHLNKSIQNEVIPSKLLSTSCAFENLYPNFPYTESRKEFIFYSYLSYNFNKLYPGLLIEIKNKHLSKLSDIVTWIVELRHILIDLINNPKHLFDYIKARATEGKMAISPLFFQIFVLCYDYFDKTQASLSNKIMVIFGIYKDLDLTFRYYSIYYLYFHVYEQMTKELQYLFLKKIINMVIRAHQINSDNERDYDGYDNGYDYDYEYDNEVLEEDKENDNDDDNDEVKDMNEDEEINKENEESARKSSSVIKENNQNVAIDNDIDIYEAFRFMFNLNDLILNFILEPYNGSQWKMMMKRKQSKIDEIYYKIIAYFNNKPIYIS